MHESKMPTYLAAGVFGLTLLAGVAIGYSAGDPGKARPTGVSVAKATTPATAFESEPTKAEPTKLKPKTPPTKAKPEPTKPEPTKPEPTKPEPTKPAPPPPTKPAEPAAAVAFAKVQAVFKAKCLLCHGDPTIKGDLDLRSLASIAKFKGAAVAGEPDKSEIWLSIKGEQMPPPNKEKLTEAEKKLIYDWIKSGAK